MHGPTFMANQIACAAAAAALDVYMAEDWEAKVRRIETELKKGLETLRGVPGVKDVRALGAIGVVETERVANNRILAAAFVKEGIWVRPFGNIFYVMPPFVIEPEELQILIDGFVRVTRKWVEKKI